MKVNYSARYFNSVPYRLDAASGLLDYDALEAHAEETKPKLIIAGFTAYSRIVDWERIAEIARKVGAYSHADIAHISGLVVAGVHPSPVGVMDVTSTTTHKSLRGPRGAMIMTDSSEIYKKVNRAIMPGLQGGPHNNTTAAIAVALKEASTPGFKEYGEQIVRNARALAAALAERGLSIVSGGTDTHLMIVDLTSKGVSGGVAAKALDRAGIETSYSTIPDDPRKPMDPSGIRLGTPPVTSRGMKEAEMKRIAEWFDVVVMNHESEETIDRIRLEIAEFCTDFPAPGLPESDW